MRYLIALGCIGVWAAPLAAAVITPAEDLANAITTMRKIDPATLTGDQQKTKGKELDDAWKTIVRAGSKGAAALKDELHKLDQTKEKDDFFRLGAGTLLWRIGKAEQAEAIGAAWSGDVNLSLNYNYVFYTAFEAAQTHDKRVLPILTATLHDQKGSIFVEQHVLTVKWPLSHEFLWGSFGPEGLPALLKVVQESKDDTARSSAIWLLAKAQYLPALETIRGVARRGTGLAHTQAIKSLGAYGHPQDYDFLVQGLKAKAPAEALPFAFALFEFEDLRAAPQLAALLNTDNAELAHEVIGGVGRLLTPEGFAALHNYEESQKNKALRDHCHHELVEIQKGLVMTYEEFKGKTPAEQSKLLADLRQAEESKYRLKPDDRKLTHDELLKAAKDWKSRHRIEGGSYAWVEDRHVLSATSPADIPLLLEVASACYSRLSDECLYETATLQDLVLRLGRSRYRAEVGICDQVKELPGPKK